MDCKGTHFKGKTNYFINKKNELVFTERLIPVSKLSCPGCKECGGLKDYLQETILNVGLDAVELTDNIEDGELYVLTTMSQGFDRETGYEEFDICISKVSSITSETII